jgi:hypothetical protein
MAATVYNGVVTSKHATLTAGDGNHDVVNFTSSYRRFEIVNMGTADIYVRSDGTAPTIGADNTEVVRAGEAATHQTAGGYASSQVMLVSVGTPTYHLRREE